MAKFEMSVSSDRSIYARLKDQNGPAFFVNGTFVYPGSIFPGRPGEKPNVRPEWNRVSVDANDDIAEIAKYFPEIDFIEENEYLQIEAAEYLNTIKNEVIEMTPDLLNYHLNDPEKDQKYYETALMILQDEKQTRENKLKIALINQKLDGKGIIRTDLNTLTLGEYKEAVNELFYVPIELFEFKVDKENDIEFLNYALMLKNTGDKQDKNLKTKIQIIQERMKKLNGC